MEKIEQELWALYDRAKDTDVGMAVSILDRLMTIQNGFGRQEKKE